MTRKSQPEHEVEPNSPRATATPGTFPLINMLVWGAQMPPLTKLVLRYMIEVAVDGQVALPLKQIAATCCIPKSKVPDHLIRLVELNVLMPEVERGKTLDDWAHAQVVKGQIKPSGLLRLFPEGPIEFENTNF